MDDMVGMGKGPGGSNDVSEYLRQAGEAYKAGKITKQQFMDHLNYYAPASVPDTMTRMNNPRLRIGNKTYE